MSASLVMDVVVWFFLLGVLARVAGSDLRLPEALYETLSIYLLLAIGLKGGIELSRQPLADLAPQVAACVALGFAIPFLLYPLGRALRLSAADAGALSAHYGSVSVVTFAVATAELARRGIAHESHAALWVAVMEAPALVSGILLVRWGQARAAAAAATTALSPPAADAAAAATPGVPGPASASRSSGWTTLAHEVVFGKSVLLLLGGMAIGAVAGVSGTEPLAPVFMDPFKGVLALFLLELGLVVGRRLADLPRHGRVVLVFGLGVPPLLALAGAGVGMALGLSTGGVALLATLAASASYIAAPTAMRIAVPEADAGLSITAALALTFPFNLMVGIPLYIALAQWLVP